MKQRFNHQAMVVQIMDDGDVDGAIRHILEITKNDKAQRRRAVFDNVRTQIMKKEQYRSEEGYQQLKTLAMREDLSPTDRMKLQTLLFKPLHFIRWAQVCRCFLSDYDLQAELREIRIVKDPFYDFDCPVTIKSMVKEDTDEQVQENHNHQRKPREHYIFNTDEVTQMITTATEYIQQDIPWTRPCNSFRLLECMCLLTGRRKWELCSTLKIKAVPGNDYLAEVQGLGKSIKSRINDTWCIIPLLAPIHLIIHGITKLRMFAHEMGKYRGGIKLFPRMTHTHYRNVYADKAYEQRAINRFREDHSCSELEWKRSALNITMGIYTERYATMITDNNDIIIDRDPAIPNPHGGSPLNTQQDSV